MPVTGVAGQLARGAPYKIDGSYVSDGNINFGAVAELSATNLAKQVRAYTGSGPIMGIAVEDPTKGFTRDASGLATEVLKYTDGNPVALLEEGCLYVTVGYAVTAGKQAYVIKTSSGSDPAIGSIVDSTFSASGSKAPIFNSIFRTSADAAAIAVLEVQLPGGAVS